ncbi:uncharacterized protein [Typha angustifolia]|uniref:uncharacterized protein n=1 Tax=Typha angustifolia TaxID=59011 RepID=UPI003C2F1B17
MSSKSLPIRWPKQLTAAHVYRLIRAEPNIHKALLLFDSATAEYPNGFRHDLHTLTLISSRLASSGLFSRALSLLSRASADLGLPASESAFLSLIRALGRAHRPLDALRLFRSAPSSFQIPHSSRSYTAILAVLVANDRLPLARSLFDEMRQNGIPPTVATYNVLIKALCVAGGGSIDAALRVFRRIATPDACSYGTLIDGLCRHGRLDAARELFREMGDKDILPTVVTYTTFVHWLSHSGCLDEAIEVFGEMSRKGVAPNVVTYSSLVDGLCKGGQAMKAMELLDRMAKERCQPNATTYSSVIDGLCKEGRMKEAMEILDRMRLQGRKPDAGLYGKVIEGLCDSGRIQEAANYLDEMILSGISPNRVTWSLHVRIHNTVVKGLCRKSELNRALQVYKSMQTRGISTELKTFHLLVEGLCKKSNIEKAAQVVYEMMAERCVPDRDTWSTIVGGYWGRRKVRDAADQMWNELVAG